jgi:endonuclease IV
LPSGSEASIEATLAQTEAQKQADAQLGITSAGYAQGNKNYEEAVNELPTATAQIENPEIGAENAANSAAGAQSEAGNQITQANDAWVAPVAGLIGSVASAKLTGKKP